MQLQRLVKNLLASLLALLIGKLKYAAITTFLCNSVFLLFLSLVIVLFFNLSELILFSLGRWCRVFFVRIANLSSINVLPVESWAHRINFLVLRYGFAVKEWIGFPFQMFNIFVIYSSQSRIDKNIVFLNYFNHHDFLANFIFPFDDVNVWRSSSLFPF